MTVTYEDLIRVRESQVQPYKLSDLKLATLLVDVDNVIMDLRETIHEYEVVHFLSPTIATADLKGMLDMRNNIRGIMRNRMQSDKELDIVLNQKPVTLEQDTFTKMLEEGIRLAECPTTEEDRKPLKDPLNKCIL